MRVARLNRRKFVTLAGGASAWPLAAGAQERPRLVGAVMGIADDAEGQRRIAEFQKGLQDLGWVEGRNIRFDYRWGSGNPDRIRADARQLIAMQPDAILANSTIVASVLKSETSTIPVVFVQVADPVKDGIVASLARPGGNFTGFTSFEYAMGGKWLETLKDLAPETTRAALLHHPQDSHWPGFFQAIEQVAQSLKVQVTPAGVRDANEIEAAIKTFAQAGNGGLVILPTPITNLHRKLVIALAARHRLPAVYAFRFFVADGGLISYGFDTVEPFRLAAGYVSRVLKGENPADLPVQAPTRFELVVISRQRSRSGYRFRRRSYCEPTR